MKINASLLREKFVIKEKSAKDLDVMAQQMHACSNRIVLDLQSEHLAKETFIIRTDSMHLCARMAGHILANYENKGPFGPRLKLLKWDLIWDSALSDHEKHYNEGRWVAIYHHGKIVYEQGNHHAFLDIIEQFQNKENANYNQSLRLAEKAFQKAGREVSIDYSSNVALTISMERTGGRCSTILRSPNKTTSLHFYIKPKKETEKIVISQGFISAANFLEGVNLSFFIGLTTAQIDTGVTDKYSNEARQMRNAKQRLGDIQISINALENRYNVRYRPERPIFDIIITNTENYTKKQILEKRQKGEKS